MESMPNILVNDLNIYYEASGGGPPLVLLPGLLGTVESDWRRFVPVLSNNYTVIAVDHRGHGRSGNPGYCGTAGSGTLDIGRMAADLIGLLDKLGYEKASVLGYSLGGCMGLLAGIKYPGRISALIMHATKFFWNKDSIASMIAGFDPKKIMEKTPRYAQTLKDNHSLVFGPDYWQDLLGLAGMFVQTMPETAPNLEQASKTDFPVLVSVGDGDKLVTLDEAVRLYRALPKGELLVLPATRHPFQTVRVEAFVPPVQEFLSRAISTN
jgi:pimeloyl-ACP methyl ester carboxylesterase